MTLLYFDGFQDDALTKKAEWSGTATTSAAGRDGSTNGARSGGNGATNTLTLPSAAATVILGVAVFLPSTALARTDNGIILGTGATDDLWIFWNATGYLEIHRTSAGGNLVATATTLPVTTSRWVHLQVRAVLHATAGTLVCQQDGIEVLNVSGVSTGTVTGSCTYVKLNHSLNQIQYDDLYVCDAVDATATQGRPNNAFLGDMKVTTLLPTTDGDVGSWSKSSGTNGAALVDEVPPNTTDYVFSSTSAQQQLFQLGDLPANVGSVFGVRASVYGLNSDAGAQSVKPLYKESGGTVTAQTAIPFSTTAVSGSGPFLFTKPSASTTPWAVSDVNALQLGVQLT